MLLIDEAQDLDDELLEQVRLLSNLETEQAQAPADRSRRDSRSCATKLNGQKACGSCASASPSATTSRRCPASETERYIDHRLRVAGGDGRPIFTPWAIRTIHRYSRGVPRLINAVCDKTLLYGFVNGRPTS